MNYSKFLIRETKEFTTDLSSEEILESVIDKFNLKKPIRYRRNTGTFSGKVTPEGFSITGNDHDDSNYFFFSQIDGEIMDLGNRRKVILKGKISDSITLGVLIGLAINILIMVFFSIPGGIFGSSILILMYVFASTRIYSGFEKFCGEFNFRILRG